MPINSNQQLASPWERALAGATGAVLANALVYPLDIVKTRLQMQADVEKARCEIVTGGTSHESGVNSRPPRSYISTYHTISQIVAEDGIDGLYIGVLGSLLGVATTNFAYFYWYSICRSIYNRTSHNLPTPSTTIELSLGAAAGAAAQLCTLPISVIATRQQTSASIDRKGFIKTAREIIDTDDGISGLWRGLKASLILVINPAITYGAYERLKLGLFPNKKNIRPSEAFFLGALSKCLATVLTHPLIVAKVGLQSKPPASRNGIAFSNILDVLRFIWRRDGFLGLFRGITPQIIKGFLVQGILMMTKERHVFTIIYTSLTAG